MAHQQPNYSGRPARGPSPRGYQQQYGSYSQQPQYGYYPPQQPRGYAYNYGGYQQFYGYQQQPRGYRGNYQRPAPQKQPASGQPKPFVKRKKNLLVIQKPDGTVVVPPPQKDTSASTDHDDSTASAVKSTTAAEPAAVAADVTAPQVKGITVKPTPEPVAVAKPKPVVPTALPAEAKPVVTPALPAEAKAEVEPVVTPAAPAEVKPATKETTHPTKPTPLPMPIEEDGSQPPTEKTTSQPASSAKKTNLAVQINDLDSWDDATIQTPGSMKSPHFPHDKTYSIEMLMKLRDSCNLEPLKSWPAFDITKAVQTPRSRESPRGGPRQRRNYQEGPRHDQRRNQSRQQWSRGQQANPRPSPRDNPRPQIKLHKTKNKWSRDKHEQSKATNHLELVKKEANSILNKLSVDNFERLLPKFLLLEIQTKRQFEAVTEIIFDKALRMPTYCHLYAKLCGEVSQKAKMFCDKIVKIVEEEEDGQKVYYYDVGGNERTDGVEGPYEESDVALTKGIKVCTFKRLLLNQCQRVFESHTSWEDAFAKAKDPSLSAAAKKKALEDAEETRFVVKQRSLGIVQFVAHLFLNSLLSEKRVHVCMSELLQRCEKELNQAVPNTEGVEVFAKIITEVGETIDNGPNKDMINLYMQNLQKISKTKGLNSRTKFMIMDVIDLREKYRWVPRLKKAKQVTKAQFKKEADAKLRDMNRKNQRRGGGGGGGNRRQNDRRGGGGGFRR